MTHTPNLRRPEPQGKAWIVRRKPFLLFLKTGGIFSLHLEVHRLCITLDPPRSERWDKGRPVRFQYKWRFRWFFLRLRRLVIALDRKM